MSRKRAAFMVNVLAAALAAALGAGCVATQKIPVSTDPSGATVYLDGQVVCATTPCSVEVPKDQDHLLTITKDGYRQKDIPLRRVYDTVGVLRNSARDGVSAAQGGAGLGEVFSGVLDSADRQERNGRSYVLSPDLVMVRLRGLGEPEPAEPRASGTGNQAVDLGLELFRMLEGDRQSANQER